MSSAHEHRLDEVESADVHERIGARLSDDGQRYTSGRRQLVDALTRAAKPITIPELSTAASDLASSSMYRNLEVLERSGLVRRIVAVADHARWELCEPLIAHHHHLICDECGGIEDVTLDDVTEEAIESAMARIAAATGFTAADHTLDLHGTCKRCSA